MPFLQSILVMSGATLEPNIKINLLHISVISCVRVFKYNNERKTFFVGQIWKKRLTREYV